MHLAEFTIRRWQLSFVLFVLLVALGLSAVMNTPRAVDPHFSMPVVFVSAAQPGADAEEVEQTIVQPIERILQGLEDVKQIDSTANSGGAVIRAEFDWAGDPDIYFNDAVREVQAARNILPPDLTSLRFEKIRTTNTTVIQVALISETASWYRMEKYARDLSEAFSRFEEVRQANIHGLPAPEMTVAIDSGRLAQLQLPASVVADAVRAGGADLPGGAVNSGGRRLNVEAGGAFRNLDELRDLPVRSSSGTVVRVGDIATVGWGAEEQRVKASHNGRRAVVITANQKQGTDATNLRDRLIQVVEKHKALLPPDIELVLQYDQTVLISKRLKELGRDFSIALALVLITLLPLGLRASAIVMISIPLSLASGLIAVQFAGYNLSQFTIAAFILSLGLLVDDSIVVVENIARHLRMGKGRDEAAIAATGEITKAVLGSTLVLIAAFFPLLFLPEGAGKFVRSFVSTVIFTVAASMLVSLTIIPFLASRMLKADAPEEGNAVLRWLMRNIERIYRPLLQRALEWPRMTVWGAMLLTFMAFGLIPVLGLSLFPNADTQHFRVTVEAEQGASIAETEAMVKKVSAILASEDDIKVRAATVGGHNPSVYYNVFDISQSSDFGEIIAVMDDWKGRKSEAMVQRLRKQLDQLAGARAKIVLFQNGAPINAPIEFRVIGPDLGELKRLAGEIETAIRNTPGTRDVVNPLASDRLDLDLRISEARAALRNVAPGAARRAVRLALSGERASVFRDNEGDSYPVVVRHPLKEAQPVSALDNVYVSSRSGGAVRLAELTDPRLKASPPAVRRHNLERYVSVTAQVRPGFVVSKINNRAFSELRKIELTKDYRIEIGGEAEKINSTFSGFGPIIMVALFTIFAILVWEFGRFRESLVVAGVIPLGTFGGLIALWLTGNTLSFLAVIGFIALIGIEIKNSILLVDFTSQLREEGMALRPAIERAGEVRFLPVLLTSVTAIGGLMPLALFGGSLYGPLAIVLIGGLVSSTILSRIVTPTMYLLVVRGAEGNGRAKSGGATSGGAAAAGA